MNIDPNFLVNSSSMEAEFRDEIEQEQNALSLIKAIQANDVVEVATILDEGGVNLNYAYKGEISPLGAASYEGNIMIMNLLYKAKAVVNFSFSGGKDAGWIAIENHKYESFDWLVENGLRVNSRLLDTYETRLILAVKNSDLRMVSRLLSLNVNSNDTDILGRTALHYNMGKIPYENDDYRIGELLLADRCDPNRKDQYGVSAHGYIEDDRVYTLLSNYELEQVDKNALLRVKEKERIAEEKIKNSAKPVVKEESKNENKNKSKFKGKKFRPK